MKKLLLIPAILLAVLFFSLFFLMLSAFPPFISFTALAIMGLVGFWWRFGRQKSAGVINSEAGIMGRHNSKDGLL